MRPVITCPVASPSAYARYDWTLRCVSPYWLPGVPPAAFQSSTTHRRAPSRPRRRPAPLRALSHIGVAHDGAASPYRIRAGLGDLHAVGVEDAVPMCGSIHVTSGRSASAAATMCASSRAAVTSSSFSEVLTASSPASIRAARPRAQSSAMRPCPAPLAQFAGVRGREVGGGAQVAVALVRQEHHVERDGRAVGGRRSKCGATLSSGSSGTTRITSGCARRF